VRFASIDNELHTLMVTSPEPGVGKSTVAANLAAVFAQAGVSTILIDCDLRRPAQHIYFNFSNRYGLSDILFDQNTAMDNLKLHTPIENLRVIPSGKLPPNPAELIASKRMKGFLDGLRDQAELIIMDTPPLQVVTDALSITPEMDGVLIVVQPGKTHVTAASQTVEQLKRAKARILGVVLNPLDLKRSQYAYRYGYKYGRSGYGEYYHNVDDNPSSSKSDV
jgi:capsular exopolysaccharide synthesis family protein